VQRPAKGMLGGMRALPDDDWQRQAAAPDAAASVDHSFTHFNLTLSLVRCAAPPPDSEGQWWPMNELDAAGLPTLYRKAVTAMGEVKA
jgi:A/G-specific adenine glycosylase